jgi:hypothetical protein
MNAAGNRPLAQWGNQRLIAGSDHLPGKLRRQPNVEQALLRSAWVNS